jgi:hypothetical protein
MAETILTGKKIEKLTLVQFGAIGGFFDAKFPQFSENFFFGKCPRNAGNRYS